MGAVLGILSGVPSAERCRLIDCCTHTLSHRLEVAPAETEGKRDGLKSNRQPTPRTENSCTASDRSRESAADTTSRTRKARGNRVASEKAFMKRTQKEDSSRGQADRRRRSKPSSDYGSETENEIQESDVDKVSNLLKEMETRGGRRDLRSRDVPECFLADIHETLKMKAVKMSISEARPPKKFASGAIYAGTWKGNSRCGVGRQVWKDGTVYEGEWKDNLPHGRGRFALANGDEYIGEWSAGLASGIGIFRSHKGTQYEGLWAGHTQHGAGVETWPDGSTLYQGEFRDGFKEGRGVLEWETGASYEGQWRQNKCSGFGVYSDADGECQYQGGWRNGEMEGFGISTWSTGRNYAGEYKRDQKEGFGVFSWEDGRIYKGFWSKGKQDGQGRYYVTEDGPYKTGTWRMGTRTKWISKDGA